MLGDTALDDFDRSIIRSYINAPAALCQYIRKAIMEAAATQKATSETALTIDEKVAAYRKELEAEKRGKERSSASPDAEEST